jgi:3-deoxy-D-manno-octulosonate 8-phosphate phosphatase (KDO 8-P phosphatase)
MSNYKQLLKQIKGLAFDVDGVFTDGQVYLFPGKEFVRSVNIKDGYAVQHCIKMGFPIAIITGGNSDEVRKRFQYLGVTDIYMGSSNKILDYEDFRMKYGFNHSEILYMGDDLPDFEIMKRVGLPTCPADAAHEIREISKYISDKTGGEGCARDVIEQILRIHDKWLVEESFQW